MLGMSKSKCMKNCFYVKVYDNSPFCRYFNSKDDVVFIVERTSNDVYSDAMLI